MMLVSETGETQATLFTALEEARPFHVRGDVDLTDVLQRRWRVAVLRETGQSTARSVRCVVIIPRIAVIHRKHITASELGRKFFNPIESSDIYLSLIFTFWRRGDFCKLALQLCARDFSFDEGEAVARFINVFLRPLYRRTKALPAFSRNHWRALA